MVNETKYLLDSDILIALLRDRTDKYGLRQKVLNAGVNNCYVSSISLSELNFGAYRMASERGMHEIAFIKSIFSILPYGQENSLAPELYGKIKNFLTASGSPVNDMDILIGVSALSEGYTMVTHNVKHFSRIPELKVEDWLEQ